METNGTNETKTADDTSTLDKLAAEFESTFKGKTTKKRIAECVDVLLKAQAHRDAAERVVASSKLAESAAVAAIVRECSGKGRVTIKGVTYTPASRGESVYLRKVSTDAVELA